MNIMADNATEPTLLLAEDDDGTRAIYTRYLESSGYRVVQARDGEEAVSLMTSDIPLAILDLQMPGLTGLDCVRDFRERFAASKSIVISALGEIPDAVEAIKLGAADFIAKPCDKKHLLGRVSQVLGGATAVDSRNEARTPPDSISQSAKSRELQSRIGRVAEIDSSILILGESGTGKTTLARQIHEQSAQQDGPFVAVNCASLPRDLIESELFGHVKGAFTGAVEHRAGRAEDADGGTLFLDEIGDLPIDLQPKLLTFLQERVFQRVGSNQEVRVNVRVIAATHQDLQQLCQQRMFREDLYYRLNVIQLQVAPLRDRVEDIVPIAQTVLRQIADRRGQAPPEFSCKAISSLERHSWPGNIRELENVLERASVFCSGSTIQVADLEFDDGCSAPGSVSDEHPFEGRTLDEIEEQVLKSALRRHDGNRARVARELGLSERSIYNKIRKLDLNSSRD